MIELQRNVVFGQFVDTGSRIHRIDPRIKILAATVVIVGSFALMTLAGLGLLIPLLALFHLAARMPLAYLLRGSRSFLIFLAVILALQVLFYGAGHTTVWWRWRWLSLSSAGLAYAGTTGLRVLILYDITTLLTLVTQLVDLTDGFEALSRPLQRVRIPVHELVLVMVVALKFVPIFMGEAERLVRARSARGVPFDSGGPLTRARRIGALLVPIFVSGFRRADTLALAMDARSYRGGAHRTKYRILRAGTGEWLALGLVPAWVIGAWLLARVLGR